MYWYLVTGMFTQFIVLSKSHLSSYFQYFSLKSAVLRVQQNYSIHHQILLECTEQIDDISEIKRFQWCIFLLIKTFKTDLLCKGWMFCLLFVTELPGRPWMTLTHFLLRSKWAFNEQIGHFHHWVYTLFIYHLFLLSE